MIENLTRNLVIDKRRESRPTHIKASKDDAPTNPRKKPTKKRKSGEGKAETAPEFRVFPARCTFVRKYSILSAFRIGFSGITFLELCTQLRINCYLCRKEQTP